MRTLLALTLLVLPALAKVDFTGDWKLNVSKSDFGAMPAPTAASMKIAHQDPELKIAIKQTSERGERESQMNYSTDGKETTNQMRGNTMKSTGKWDGDTAVLETKGSFDGNDFSIRDRMALSADGKTLTVNRHLSGPMGELDQTMILEKQ